MSRYFTGKEIYIVSVSLSVSVPLSVHTHTHTHTYTHTHTLWREERKGGPPHSDPGIKQLTSIAGSFFTD